MDSISRPPLPEVQPIYHSGPFGMEMLPAKYTHTLERNQKLKICCRHTENMRATFYCSPTASKNQKGEDLPDIMIAVCVECSCRHIRMQVGGGNINGKDIE
jgi:hypothetical protein